MSSMSEAERDGWSSAGEHVGRGDENEVALVVLGPDNRLRVALASTSFPRFPFMSLLYLSFHPFTHRNTNCPLSLVLLPDILQ